ncbi:Activated RNA polymerase II transcriptional coactivator p15 [Amphibalanus amphitrite]|uniref:Activated RNA polymerase II transcriptional coactivator p15 n=1 Tax=Amphibalanus amphitrite TaxID=1232801 RepID=A0A6A4WEB2_AMPAM|nr:Activated RNA polymerase II transcriptional coactivator p15 [Amphibalanus amphitrite]
MSLKAGPVKKSRPSAKAEAKGDSGGGATSCEVVNGEPTWTIAPKRFVKIRKFKGKTYVDIREYWNDDKGDLKPGKKGISMSMEQWDMFTQIIPEISKRL